MKGSSVRKVVGTAAIGVLAVCVPGGAAQAIPSGFGGNAYEFVSVANPFTGANNTWATASAAAAISSFNGVNGHLATVTSLAENNFLLSLVTASPQGFNGAWLGGNFQGWLEGPEAGQTFAQAGGFTKWNPVEPNNSGLTYMSIGTTTPNAGVAGNWADDSGVNGTPDSSFDPVIGYFIEYENAAVALPEPSTFGLLGIGLVWFRASRRRRNSRCSR